MLANYRQTGCGANVQGSILRKTLSGDEIRNKRLFWEWWEQAAVFCNFVDDRNITRIKLPRKRFTAGMFLINYLSKLGCASIQLQAHHRNSILFWQLARFREVLLSNFLCSGLQNEAMREENYFTALYQKTLIDSWPNIPLPILPPCKLYSVYSRRWQILTSAPVDFSPLPQRVRIAWVQLFSLRSEHLLNVKRYLSQRRNG